MLHPADGRRAAVLRLPLEQDRQEGGFSADREGLEAQWAGEVLAAAPRLTASAGSVDNLVRKKLAIVSHEFPVFCSYASSRLRVRKI